MPLPGSLRQVLGEPREALGLVARAGSRRAVSESRASGPRMTATPSPSCSATSATTRSLAVAVVARTGTRRVEQRQDPADAPVVGPEVVAPVGDAVRLVDDEQPDRALDARQDVGREALVGEPLGRDRAGRRSRSAASPSLDASHSSTLPELIVAARRPEPVRPSRSGCASARAAG